MAILNVRSIALVVQICGLGLAGCTQTNSQDEAEVGARKSPQSGSELHVARVGLTVAQCQEQGGFVVGDIGNGAIHRADYLCASGKKPIGSILYTANDSIAVEGAVCCT